MDLKITAELALKFEDIHKTIKNLMGDDFDAKIKPFMDLIRSVQVANKIPPFEALAEIIKTDVSEEQKISFCAAAVQLTYDAAEELRKQNDLKNG